jgi:hypothetical protein
MSSIAGTGLSEESPGSCIFRGEMGSSLIFVCVVEYNERNK